MQVSYITRCTVVSNLMDEVSTGSGSDRVRLPASSILLSQGPGRHRSRY